MSQSHENIYNSRHLGASGEQYARHWLEDKGYTWIAQNIHMRWSELDLIMYQGPTLVFIEVKYRRTERYGNALESITRTKQKKLRQAAEVYLLKHPHSGPIRFDAIGILHLPRQDPVFTHIENAF